MFKGNDDSSSSENEDDTQPIIDQSLIINDTISNQHLICSICHNIVWEPVSCGSQSGCQNVFCNLCITKWLENSNRLCPTCKRSFVKSSVPPILHSLLENLIIKCNNHFYGCSKQISYTSFQLHAQNCEYKLQRCRGCKQKIIVKDYSNHIQNCDQFVIECERCHESMTKEKKKIHSRVECFEQQIQNCGKRVGCIEHSIKQLDSSLTKLEDLTKYFLSGQALQLNIQLYTAFNQHFIFPNPTLIKPSFNQIKEKFDFLHFYVLNPIYTDSIASIKWTVKINKMIGNILLGFCSSLQVNSIDYIINKYGEVKKKQMNISKYKIIRKSEEGFTFSCGDVIKFKYVSLKKCIKITNETKKVEMHLLQKQIEDIGDKIFTFYSMDTLNDSISFL